MNLQQNIIIRTDLGFTRGLLTAQVAHIHALPMVQAILEHKESTAICLDKMFAWLSSPFVTVLGASNIEILDHFIDLAEAEGIVVHQWRDVVNCNVSDSLTLNFDTIIGASFGPDESDKLKKIMGQLPLLK